MLWIEIVQSQHLRQKLGTAVQRVGHKRVFQEKMKGGLSL